MKKIDHQFVLDVHRIQLMKIFENRAMQFSIENKKIGIIRLSHLYEKTEQPSSVYPISLLLLGKLKLIFSIIFFGRQTNRFVLVC